MQKFYAWLKSDSGATAVEYGLIVGGIGVAVSALVFGMGDGLNTIFEKIDTKLTSVLD